MYSGFSKKSEYYSLEEDDEAREREIRQNIIVMMIKKFDLLYRLNKTLFQRIAIFLKPVRFREVRVVIRYGSFSYDFVFTRFFFTMSQGWQDHPLPGLRGTDYEFVKLTKTPEGFHEFSYPTGNLGDAGMVVKTNLDFRKNTGTWRVYVRVKKCLRYNYIGLAGGTWNNDAKPCNVPIEGNLSNYFGIQSQSGRIYNYGEVHANSTETLGPWKLNDIIVVTVNTTGCSSVRIAYIRNDDFKKYAGRTKKIRLHHWFNGKRCDFACFCLNMSVGSHFQILRVQSLVH